MGVLVPLDRPADTDTQDRALLDMVARAFLLGHDAALGAFVQPIQPGPALIVRSGLEGWLRRQWFESSEGQPSNDALSRCLAALEAVGDSLEPTALYLRVGRAHDTADSAIVLDLAEPDSARAVVIEDGGWRVVDEAPCPFFRTRLTGTHPEPLREGSLEPLWEFVGVPVGLRPLVVAWLVAALIPELAHPVLVLEGPAGSGKTTAATLLARLIDPFGPVSAQVRRRPRDERDWQVQVRSSWVIALDNLRRLPLWLSDDLCTVVTGAATVERQLYTNAEAHVMALRRVALLTSIGLEELADDLADRSLKVELERPRTFVSERTLAGAMEEMRPYLLGGLLTVAAAVLQRWQHMVGRSTHRLADFGLLVKAVDELWSAHAEEALSSVEGQARTHTAESSPVAHYLLELPRPWSYTVGQLLGILNSRRNQDRAPTGERWPTTPRHLVSELTRLVLSFREYGVQLEIGQRRERRGGAQPAVWIDCTEL
jgi:hypothetical protein